jgi:hypothetical protein
LLVAVLRKPKRSRRVLALHTTKGKEGQSWGRGRPGAIQGEDRSTAAQVVFVGLVRCVPEGVNDDASDGFWEWVMTGVALGHIDGTGTAFKVRRFD